MIPLLMVISSSISSRFFLSFAEIKSFVLEQKKINSFINEIFKVYKLLKSNTYNSKSNFVDGFDIFHLNTAFSEKACVQRIKEQFFKNGQISEFAEFNLIYLNAIIEMCRQKGVELVLITTPLHSKYIQGIPKPYIEKFLKFVRVNNSINLENIALVDSCFRDGDHINNKGIFKTNKILKSKF